MEEVYALQTLQALNHNCTCIWYLLRVIKFNFDFIRESLYSPICYYITAGKLLLKVKKITLHSNVILLTFNLILPAGHFGALFLFLCLYLIGSTCQKDKVRNLLNLVPRTQYFAFRIKNHRSEFFVFFPDNFDEIAVSVTTLTPGLTAVFFF